MTCLNNLDQHLNKSWKENNLSDGDKLYNIEKKLDSTSLKINKMILKKENLESKDEHIPIGITIDIERNKYKVLSIYQSLIDTYPVKTEFSDEEKNCMELVNLYNPGKLSVNENYVHFPQFNWHIPSEMDSTVFTIGDDEVSRLELELGIIYENGHVLEGPTTRQKIDQEFQELKQAVASKSDFKNRRDSLLFHEYKIHFMPKPQYFARCVIKLIKKISEDKTLRSHLHTMKVTINPYEDLSQCEHRPPSIVVYPILGKSHAEQALTILFDHFKSDLKMASYQNPRFNVETRNGLITYAQGDGYTKVRTLEKHPKLFSKIFDLDGAHFNAKFGSFHLTVPENF